MSNPGLFDILGGLLDSFGIDFKTDRPDTVLLRGGYDDSPVAGTKIIDYVPLFNLGQLEHPIDHLLRRRNVRNNFPFLRLSRMKVKNHCRDQPKRESEKINARNFVHCCLWND